MACDGLAKPTKPTRLFTKSLCRLYILNAWMMHLLERACSGTVKAWKEILITDVGCSTDYGPVGSNNRCP